MNDTRNSWIGPIAIVAVVVGLWLFLTKRISGFRLASIAICMVLACLVWCALEKIGMALQNTANHNLKTAEAVVCIGQQQITFTKVQERKEKRELLILIISLMILSLEVIRLLHGH